MVGYILCTSNSLISRWIPQTSFVLFLVQILRGLRQYLIEKNTRLHSQRKSFSFENQSLKSLEPFKILISSSSDFLWVRRIHIFHPYRSCHWWEAVFQSCKSSDFILPDPPTMPCAVSCNKYIRRWWGRGTSTNVQSIVRSASYENNG